MTATARPTAPRRIRPASESITLMDLADMDARTCSDCGIALNQRPQHNDSDPYLAEDRVPSGSRLQRGHVTLCKICAHDPGKRVARKRRLRKTSGVNFLD